MGLRRGIGRRGARVAVAGHPSPPDTHPPTESVRASAASKALSASDPLLSASCSPASSMNAVPMHASVPAVKSVPGQGGDCFGPLPG
jgi:hypothetical protein